MVASNDFYDSIKIVAKKQNSHYNINEYLPNSIFNYALQKKMPVAIDNMDKIYYILVIIYCFISVSYLLTVK